MPNILITGASRGIGLELVKQYIHDNCQVFACCRNPKQAKELQQIKKTFPHDLTLLKLDVTKQSDINKLADRLKNDPIDILINNAGIYGPIKQNFGSLETKDWIKVFAVNTIAPIKITEALVSQVAQSKLKTIAIISSKFGSITGNIDGQHYIYRSSKAAANAAFKNLAIELKDKKITVIVLHPGWVKTDMGGQDALLEPRDSVVGLRKILSSVTLQNTGSFIAYDSSIIPW